MGKKKCSRFVKTNYISFQLSNFHFDNWNSSGLFKTKNNSFEFNFQYFERSTDFFENEILLSTVKSSISKDTKNYRDSYFLIK